eukprot:g36497.t1
MNVQAVRRFINARFISRSHKIVQNVTHVQCNGIHALETIRNIIIKPADKGGAIVIPNRTDYCEETSIPHDDGIAVTAFVLNVNNCQFPYAIPQLISFILKHNVFTFNNQPFIQTHGTALRTKFAPQYANIFMHKFKQDFFAAQDLQPMLYTRYSNNTFFLWTLLSLERRNHTMFSAVFTMSKLPSLQDNIDHNTTEPCHGNLYKTHQITDMDTTIT